MKNIALILILSFTLISCTISDENNSSSLLYQEGTGSVSTGTDSATGKTLTIESMTYSSSEVASHSAEWDCWTIVDWKVYDISWAFGNHGWWDEALMKLCWIEWTQTFTTKHGWQEKPESFLDSMYIWDLETDDWNDNPLYQGGSGSTSTWSEDLAILEAINEFNNVYKQALFATGKGEESSIKPLVGSLGMWENIEKKYLSGTIEEFSKTPDYKERLIFIWDLMRNAEKLVSENKKYAESHEELEMVREKLKELRQENGIKNISDDMLVVHGLIEEIVLLGSDRNSWLLLSLKNYIPNLRKYNEWNEAYKEALDKFENTFLELYKVNKPQEYGEKVKELKPAFTEFYLNFG